MATSAAASGLHQTTGAEALLRNGRRYLRVRMSRNRHQTSSYIEDNNRNSCHMMGDDPTQANLYGKPKLALYHTRNPTLDLPFYDPSGIYDNVHKSNKNNYNINNARHIQRKNLRTEMVKGSDKSRLSSVEPRTYAKMIADYSEAIDRQTRISKDKVPPRGLLSRLPFESVVSTLSKFERPKLSLSKQQSKLTSTNTTVTVNKESNHTLADRNEKGRTEKSPTSRKDGQKRDFFATYGEKLVNEPEDKNLIGKIIDANRKQIHQSSTMTEKSKSNATITEKSRSRATTNAPVKTQKDFDLICGYTVIEKDSGNFASSRVKSGDSPDAKAQSVKVNVNDLRLAKLRPVGKFENLSIVTSEDKIEIQIPIKTDSRQKLYTPDSKVSILSLQISTRLQENNRKSHKSLSSHTISSRNYNNVTENKHLATKASEITESSAKTMASKANDQPLKRHQKPKSGRKTKNLPWWTQPEPVIERNSKVSSRASQQLHDLYSTPPVVRVLVSEEVSPTEKSNWPKKSEKSAPTPATAARTQHQSVQPQPERLAGMTSSASRPRRKKKLTSISKITRHIEEEIENRRNELKSKFIDGISPVLKNARLVKVTEKKEPNIATSGASAISLTDNKKLAVVADEKKSEKSLSKTITDKGQGLKIDQKKPVDVKVEEKIAKPTITPKKLADIKIAPEKIAKPIQLPIITKSNVEVPKETHKILTDVTNKADVKIPKSAATPADDTKSSAGKSANMNIGKSVSTSVGKSTNTSIGKSTSTSVGKSTSTSVGKSTSTSVGKSTSASVGKSTSTNLGKSASTSLGKSTSSSAAKKAGILGESASGIIAKMRTDVAKNSGPTVGKMNTSVIKSATTIVGETISTIINSQKKSTPQVSSEKSKPADRPRGGATVAVPEPEKKSKLEEPSLLSKKAVNTDQLKPIEKKKDGTLIDYGLKVPTRKPRPPHPTQKSQTEMTPKKTISAPLQQQQQTQPKSPVSEPSKSVATTLPARKIKAQPSKQQMQIDDKTKEKEKENVTLASALKNRGKPGGGGGGASGGGMTVPGRQLPTTHSDKNSKGDNGKTSAAPVLRIPKISAGNRGDSVHYTTAKSSPQLNQHLIQLRGPKVLGGFTQQTIASTRTPEVVDVRKVDSHLSVESERSVKELIYSAWLNRFHTRKHDKTIK